MLLGADAAHMIPYSTSTDIGWRNDLLNVSKVEDSITDETLYTCGSDDRHLLYPGYSEGLRTLNAWYNEGLVLEPAETSSMPIRLPWPTAGCRSTTIPAK